MASNNYNFYSAVILMYKTLFDIQLANQLLDERIKQCISWWENG